MKRSLFGAGLLAALFILGFLVQWGSAKLHDPIREALDKAEAAAKAEDWEQVDELIGQAKTHWYQGMALRSAVADHDYLEQINSGFAGLAVWQAAREPTATAALCAELSQQVEALGEAQKLSWRNVL